MSSKKWLCMFAAAILLALTACAAFNILVDPFGAFGDPIFNWYGYNETNNPRVAKLSWLKQHSQDYDSYVIGSSSAASYSVEELNEYLDARFYNLFVYGCDTRDYVDFAAWLVENCQVKNLVLNLGLNEATAYNIGEDSINDRMPADTTGRSMLQFYLEYAFCNPRLSADKLSAWFRDEELPQYFDVFEPVSGCYDKRLRDIEKIGDPDVYAAAHGEDFAFTPGEGQLPCIQECARSVAAIRDLCAQNGINLIVITSPVYYGQWSLYSEDALRAYKTALAEEVDFWDFSITPASYDSRYFYDATHFRNALGTMVLAEMFGNQTVYRPQRFGTYVTAENCQSHMDRLFSHPPVPSPPDYTADVPILMYHHVVEEVTDGSDAMAVSQEALDRQLRLLAEEGFHAVTAQELIDYVYHGGSLPEKPVFITFDDGYYSNYSLACPLLEKYGLNATVFSIGSSMGHMEYYKDTGHPITPHFGYGEAREMQRTGVIDVQSHTYDMHQWPAYETGSQIRSNILPLEGERYEDYAAALQSDLAAYNRERETELGAPFCALAYPEGQYCDWTEVLVHQADIPLTLSTRTDSRNVLVRGLPQSLYALCRWYVTENTTPSQLRAILQGT